MTNIDEPMPLDKGTFYLEPEHHLTLDELKLSLRKRQIKTDKSQLVRTAIELLAEQEINVIADRLS